MSKKRRAVIFNIARSYKEAKEFAIRYEISLTPEQRLDILQSMREDELLFRNARRKRLRTIHKVIKGKRS